LLRAVQSVAAELPDIKCLIAGDGPERKKLEGLRKELGLEESVFFLGNRNDVPDFIASLDMFLLPSRWEGMPNVLLEAMACGKPCIASAVGGCPDLIEDGKQGLLVKPEDPGELARTVFDLLAKKDRAAKMGRAARARVEAEFSLTSMIELNQDLYEKLLREL
jgi:glycosyltransferase involved in cell wall biosynthesis